MNVQTMKHFSSFGRNKVFTGQATTGRGTLRLIQLGGAGNVTKNMYAYEYREEGRLKDILLVDCGVGFPDPDMYGIDLVIPDIRYLADKTTYIRGLVFTHGHDDHIGALPYLYPKLGGIPMWGTPLTAAFANLKLREVKIAAKVTPVDYDKTITLGVFRVSFIRLTHSIPDPSHLVIETPIGIVYHGADFKFDFNPLDGKLPDIDAINAVGRRNVLLMTTDCLGSERPGFTPSEQKIRDAIIRDLDNTPGKFLFTTQSSNISRIQLAIDIARSRGRQVTFLGRSVNQNVEESVKLSYMRFHRELIVRDRDLKRVPPSKQFLIVAGAQGQPESALSRIANDRHQFVSIGEGDTVMFSADAIPGNENSVNALIDQIYRSGARVTYTGIADDLHVSGHGSQADLMLLLSALGPKYILPIGGTYRHVMNYRMLAQEYGYQKKAVLIPNQGEVLELYPDRPPRVVETISMENVMVDGLGIGDVGNVVLRDRQTIASEGIVVVVVPIDGETGKVVGEADVISRGFVYIKESGPLLDKAKHVVTRSIVTKKGRISDWRFVREQVEENLQMFLKKETGRAPLIVPVILEV